MGRKEKKGGGEPSTTDPSITMPFPEKRPGEKKKGGKSESLTTMCTGFSSVSSIKRGKREKKKEVKGGNHTPQTPKGEEKKGEVWGQEKRKGER